MGPKLANPHRPVLELAKGSHRPDNLRGIREVGHPISFEPHLAPGAGRTACLAPPERYQKLLSDLLSVAK